MKDYFELAAEYELIFQQNEGIPGAMLFSLGMETAYKMLQKAIEARRMILAVSLQHEQLDGEDFYLTP